MRKRSEAKREASAAVAADKAGTFVKKYTGTLCPQCSERRMIGVDARQWWCPSGVTCDRGHGAGEPSSIVDHVAVEPAVTRAAAEAVVASISGQLDAVMKAAAHEGRLEHVHVGDAKPAAERPLADGREVVEGRAASLPPLFDRVNQRGLAKDYEAIVERTYVGQDALKVYNALQAKLTIGEKRTDYATVLRALDEAEDCARQAHQLYVTARLERERYEIEVEPVIGAMREKATAMLQAEKDQGVRNKTITEADVSATCAAVFPDEWRTHRLERVRVKGMEESMERFAELWKRRCSTLETILTTMRRG